MTASRCEASDRGGGVHFPPSGFLRNSTNPAASLIFPSSYTATTLHAPVRLRRQHRVQRQLLRAEHRLLELQVGRRLQLAVEPLRRVRVEVRRHVVRVHLHERVPLQQLPHLRPGEHLLLVVLAVGAGHAGEVHEDQRLLGGPAGLPVAGDPLDRAPPGRPTTAAPRPAARPPATGTRPPTRRPPRPAGCACRRAALEHAPASGTPPTPGTTPRAASARRRCSAAPRRAAGGTRPAGTAPSPPRSPPTPPSTRS